MRAKQVKFIIDEVILTGYYQMARLKKKITHLDQLLNSLWCSVVNLCH